MCRSDQKTFISLFSGCGGLDLGLSRAGFKAILANDIDTYCADSFKSNFPMVPFYPGSVGDLSKSVIKKYSNGNTNHVSLIAGGPPCPPYSKSRFYRKEKPRALDDPLGIETLNGYLNVLKTIKPKAFLFENVAGFAYKIHKEALDILINLAEDLGYICTWSVINAADYGVPQKRERFILVGMLGKKFTFPKQSNVDPNKKDLFTMTCKPWRTAGEVLSDLDTEENADDTGHFAGGRFHHLLKEVPPGQNYLYFTKERGHPNPVFKWRSRYWSFLLKLSPDMPSWTIQARRSNNMGPFHWRNRILRIEEVKRLQTFPDNWKLTGTIEQQWRQIGNAVPPKLAENIGRAIIDQLEEG